MIYFNTLSSPEPVDNDPKQKPMEEQPHVSPVAIELDPITGSISARMEAEGLLVTLDLLEVLSHEEGEVHGDYSTVNLDISREFMWACTSMVHTS